MRAVELVRVGLDAADILILNKFGKLECEGGGFRGLIADAIDATVPIVIFVPRRNLGAWRSFVGARSTEWCISDLPIDGTMASETLRISPVSASTSFTDYE